jgi:hyaluronoglucosaminidase
LTPELGVIEGYFGKPWSFRARSDVAAALAPHGYGFYHYAPKADAFLRRKWREPYPETMFMDLRAFSAHCKSLGMRFGVGLSPYGAGEEFAAKDQRDLETKIAALLTLGLDDLAIFFDDMPVTKSDVAPRQAEVIACARGAAPKARLIMCPSFYSDDSVLERVFGAKPKGYLRQLGALLPKEVDIYWTGEEVCAREYTPGHLKRVAGELQRKPLLWDNYPVNDGPRMSRFLHVRGFTGRQASIGRYIRGHAINPALQPYLSCIPALTLAASYRKGAGYAYMAAFRVAAAQIANKKIAAALEADILAVQDEGLDRLSDTRKDKLRAKWRAIKHPIADEILGWLDGAYATNTEEVQTQ